MVFVLSSRYLSFYQGVSTLQLASRISSFTHLMVPQATILLRVTLHYITSFIPPTYRISFLLLFPSSITLGFVSLALSNNHFSTHALLMIEFQMSYTKSCMPHIKLVKSIIILTRIRECVQTSVLESVTPKFLKK